MNDFVLYAPNGAPIFKYSYSEHLEKPYTIYLTDKIEMHFDDFIEIIYENVEEIN